MSSSGLRLCGAVSVYCTCVCMCDWNPWDKNTLENAKWEIHTHMYKGTQIHMHAKTRKCEYKYTHPKGIFASVWLDTHLFKQSGAHSRILANNISSA